MSILFLIHNDKVFYLESKVRDKRSNEIGIIKKIYNKGLIIKFEKGKRIYQPMFIDNLEFV